ncbi:MAG: sugar phosphate isomerase/epimerase [Rhodothermales bacterium]
MSSYQNRRHFFKQAAAGALGAPLALSTPIRRHMAGQTKLHLGVATYSLRKFDRPAAIEMIRALRADLVSVKSFHLPYELSSTELASAAGEFRSAGLTLASSGNNSITEDTDEHVRMFFDYARAAGIPMLVIAPRPEVLPRIERFVKSYDISVAIHNHGPEDTQYPAPSDALRLISGMDPRVGLCVDVGHTTRTGKDVVQEIADAGDRVLDVHMKDLRDLADKDSQCIVGEGAMPVPEIFRQLASMNYKGSVNLEYEIDEDDPLPGMKQSFAYMRGVGAALGLRSDSELRQ